MSIRRLEVATLSPGPITVDAHAGVLIPGVKFPTPFTYAKIAPGLSFKVKYIEERWHWFNKHLFGGVMKPPLEIEITRNTGEIKTFGSWTSGYRLLKMHPKLWELKDESQALGTLVHEMAHQYETEHRPRSHDEILKGGADRGAHGPTWQAIMAEIGMPVDATYKGGRQALQTDSERRVVKRYENPYVRKAGPENLIEEQNLLVHVDFVKGKETPVVIVGNRQRNITKWGLCVPGFDAKDLKTRGWHWYPMSSLFVPDKIQITDFPRALFSESASNMAYRILMQTPGDAVN